MFKYEKLEKAYTRVHGFMQAYKAGKQALERIKENYKGEMLAKETGRVLGEMQSAYASAYGAVAELNYSLDMLRQKISTGAMLSEDVAEDFKYLSLPVVLSSDQLATLYERNKGNALFCQALNQYANSHGIDASFAPASAPGADACAKVKTMFSPIRAARCRNEYDMGSTVNDMEWAFARLDDLMQADELLYSVVQQMPGADVERNEEYIRQEMAKDDAFDAGFYDDAGGEDMGEGGEAE